MKSLSIWLSCSLYLDWSGHSLLILTNQTKGKIYRYHLLPKIQMTLQSWQTHHSLAISICSVVLSRLLSKGVTSKLPSFRQSICPAVSPTKFVIEVSFYLAFPTVNDLLGAEVSIFDTLNSLVLEMCSLVSLKDVYTCLLRANF